MKLNIELASSKKKEAPAPKQLDKQVGSAVTDLQLLYQKYAIDPRKYSAKDFERMRQSDGTFMAINNLLTLPILATNWDIVADDENDPTGEQAEFVRNAFMRPPERGGMTTPFHLVLAEMLRALAEGYRYFEKVYTLSPDGKIVYRKLAGYDADTITIKTDNKGGFDGVDQRLTLGDDPVHIPVEKSFLFTNGKERNWLKGESMFVAAAYHYEEKHQLYYLGRLQAQAGSIPPRVARAGERSTQEAMDAVAQTLSDLVELNSAVVLPFGYEMQSLGSVAKVDILPLITHHNLEMTRSVLAQAIMLGGEGSSGSWALSKDQTDLLNLVLEGIMKNIEYHISAYLIPDLTEFNFAKPSYPQFKFAGLTDATLGILETAFTAIVNQKPEKLTDTFVEKVIEKMALQLDIDLNEIKPGASLSKKEHLHNRRTREGRRFLADEDRKWRRDLTEAEKKVNLAGLIEKQDTLESELDENLGTFFEELAETTAQAVKDLIDDGKLDEALAYQIPEATRKEYADTLEKAMTDAFNYAKTGAANELGEESPATTKEQKTIIRTQAEDYVSQQFAQIEAQVHALINSEAKRGQLSRTELGVAEVVTAIIKAITDYFGIHVIPGNTAAVANSINIGRAATFTAYADKIGRYEYSAILDESTCKTCEALDSSVVTPEDYETTQWQPPIHFYCRCIWIAILVAELEPPEITGLADNPGGQAAPGLV